MKDYDVIGADAIRHIMTLQEHIRRLEKEVLDHALPQLCTSPDPLPTIAIALATRPDLVIGARSATRDEIEASPAFKHLLGVIFKLGTGSLNPQMAIAELKRLLLIPGWPNGT